MNMVNFYSYLNRLLATCIHGARAHLVDHAPVHEIVEVDVVLDRVIGATPGPATETVIHVKILKVVIQGVDDLEDINGKKNSLCTRI